MRSSQYILVPWVVYVLALQSNAKLPQSALYTG